MAENEGLQVGEEFVYRISTAEEWAELQKSGATFGGDPDKSTGCFHLSKLDQSFLLNVKEDLYLLQIDVKSLETGCFMKPLTTPMYLLISMVHHGVSVLFHWMLSRKQRS